jgi:hypothetical protein
VNQLFLNRVGVHEHDDFRFVLGKIFRCELDQFAKLAEAAGKTAVRLDEALAAKFGLARSERPFSLPFIEDLAGFGLRSSVGPV